MFIIFWARGKSAVKGYREEKEAGIPTRVLVFMYILGRFHRQREYYTNRNHTKVGRT